MIIAEMQVNTGADAQRFDPNRTGAVRRPKAGDFLARKLVRSYRGLPDGVSHPLQMLQTFKRAWPRLGISRKSLQLYDYLFSLTGPQDWHKDRLALVWPSNDRLLADLDIYDVSHLKKLFRQLRALGLIDYKDSPTRKRYGRRLADGTIDYPNSFGIVLNSIAGLHAELAALAHENVVQQRYRKAVKRAIGAVRRERDDLLCAADAVMEAESFAARIAVFDALDASLAETGRDFDAKEALLERYRIALDTLLSELADDTPSPLSGFSQIDAEELDRQSNWTSNIPPTGSMGGPSIRYITAPLPNSSNRLSDQSSEAERAKSGPTEATADGGLETKSATSPGDTDQSAPRDVADLSQSDGPPEASLPQPGTSMPDSGVSRRLARIRAMEADQPPPPVYAPAKISIRQVRAALPGALGIHVREDWGFYQLYDHLRDAFSDEGLCVRTLDEARLLMGRDRASACAAVILAKRGQLKHPDSYLRGLMSKYRDGALRIERSLFGIIAERKKRRPETRKLPL